ncbi:hypothetical protein JCM3770_002156 [Rhodotorula araucariae]
MIPPDRDDAPAERPPHHVLHPLTGTLSFRNPWPSASAPTASELLFGGAWLGWPKLHLNKHPKARELKVLDPGDWGRAKVSELRAAAERDGKGSKVGFARSTWLGHAAVLVQIPLDVPPDPLAALRRRSAENEPDEGDVRGGGAGAVDVQDQYGEEEGTTLKLLFDPIFSERAGPTSYTGPGRLRAAPCAVQDLPGVDAVLISHNHYDHLDAASIKQVLEKWPRVKFFVPLGNKQWFFTSGVPLSQIYELDWWDDVDLTPSDFGLAPPPLASPSPPLSTYGDGLESGRSSRSRSSRNDQPREQERIRFTCVPAQHNSGRSPADQGSTLWCGWVVEHLLESGPPDPSPFFHHGQTKDSAVTASTDSFVSAPEADLAEEPFTTAANSVLVEEPEEGDFAIEVDEDDSASAAPGPSTGVHLEPPSPYGAPFLAPSDASHTDLSLQRTRNSAPASGAVAPLQIPKTRSPSRSADTSPSRRNSVSQLLHRSSSFSKSLTRRLSSAERPSPTHRNSQSTPATPSPLSRSSSLRAERERLQARQASALSSEASALSSEASLALGDNRGDGDGADGANGTHDADGSSGGGSGSGTSSSSASVAALPDEGDLAAEERERLRAARAKRADSEVGRAVHDGRWSKRILRKGAIFHAGDTGYRRHRRCEHPVCPVFDEIGLRFGPFDISFVPIWRGGSLGFVSAIGLRLHHENISSALHGSPADAVDIHLDVRSRNTIGVHFGTFIGSESESLEAIIELHEAVEEAGVKALDDPNEDEMGRMGVIDIGETWCSEIHNLLIVS